MAFFENNTLVMGSKGMALLKDFEGFEQNAYKDAVGIWTIGYGHTGDEVAEGMRITRDEAEVLLAHDLARFESAVKSGVTRRLHQSQFDAMVSLAYNIGASAFKESTMLKRFNDGDSPEHVVEAWLWWNKGGGRILPGLVRRRRAESNLFLGVR